MPEELEQYHLKDVQQDVASSNGKFRQFLVEQAARAQATEQADQQERERLEQLKNRLKFD